MLISQRARNLLGHMSPNARVFVAPGRVNLIGDHTDYNDGFVLPMAIERETLVAVVPRTDAKVRVRSLDLDALGEFDLEAPPARKPGSWLDYVEGVARVLAAGGHQLRGADLTIGSDIPAGAGLSSSAALEIAVGRALLAAAGLDLEPKALALAAQKAEHEYVGTKCGIMDQFVCALGREDQALFIDCRSLESSWAPLGGVRVVITDTKTKHRLAGSEYNTRRAECEEGVALLARGGPGVRALRDVKLEDLLARQRELPRVVFRRCRHVVSENARALAARQALHAADYAAFGRLMFESHDSLRDDYEVTVPELDVLVDAARAVPGVFGSRMTGGGFGGCTVSLVAADAVHEFTRRSCAAFESAFQRTPDIFVTRAMGGARELALSVF
jgi:galactokinase